VLMPALVLADEIAGAADGLKVGHNLCELFHGRAGKHQFYIDIERFAERQDR
jgi:hypothetical protein